MTTRKKELNALYLKCLSTCSDNSNSSPLLRANFMPSTVLAPFMSLENQNDGQFQI